MNDDNYTLPVGLTDAAVTPVPPDRVLDEYFAKRSNVVTDSPEAIRDRCLKLARFTLEQGYTELPYEYARAAAHWQKVIDAQRAA